MQLSTSILSNSPKYFENLCTKILKTLCEDAISEGKPYDDCVDFIGYSFARKKIGLEVPYKCLPIVLGQAKRYQRTNIINIRLIREYLGGAIKRKHDLLMQSKIASFTPVIYAFWTTSDFDSNSKKYMKDLGIWYLNGRGVSEYLHKVGVTI